MTEPQAYVESAGEMASPQVPAAPGAGGTHPWLWTVLLVGVTAIWGWTFTGVHDAVAAYPTLGFLSVRFTLAAVVLAPLVIGRLSASTVRVGGVIGLSLAAGYYFQTLGLETTTPTNSGLITGLFVVLVPVVDRLLFRVRPSRAHLIALSVSAVGMALLVGQSPKELFLGDLATAAGALAFALHISLLSRYAPRHDVIALAGVQMATMAVVFWIGWVATGPVTVPPRVVWPTLLITAVLASAVAFWVQTAAQSRLPAIRTGIILSTEPMFAGLFGFLLAGDRLRALQWIGAGMIVVAIFVAEVLPVWRRRRKKP